MKKPLLERFQQLAGIKPLYEQPTDHERWACTECKGCERQEDGPYTSEDECINSPCFSGTLNDYALSLGYSDDVPGVEDTLMSAEDQFCVKCQSTEQAGEEQDPKCECCSTDYTYDANVLTYGDEDEQEDGPDVSFVDPGKAPLANKPKKLPRTRR